MESQPGVVQPQSYPWRNLTARPENNGPILNPAGYGNIGGLDGPGKWPKEGSALLKTDTGSSMKSATGALKGR